MSSVLTLILNWRTPDMTLRAAAAAVAAMDGLEGAITLIDNDSGDGSEARLRTEVAARGWDRVRVIQSGRNGGFGAGNNAGIRAGLPDGTAPDYVYVLNSDAFPAPDAIRRLRDHLDANPDVGLAGSHIRGEDDTPHVTCFRFPSVWSELESSARTGPVSRLLSRSRVTMQIPEEGTMRVDWLAGASLMMRRRMLDQIGLFDEGYFLYYEETDLCLRAARAGWPADYLRESEVVHIGSASTGMGQWPRVPGYWFDSRRRYFVKNHGRMVFVAATAAHLAGGLLHRLRCLLGRRSPADPPHFLRDLLRHAVRGGLRPELPAHTAAAGHPAPRPVRSET
ncbi:MAG: glycosyltransferase [Gemmobacter sp.]